MVPGGHTDPPRTSRGEARSVSSRRPGILVAMHRTRILQQFGLVGAVGLVAACSAESSGQTPGAVSQGGAGAAFGAGGALVGAGGAAIAVGGTGAGGDPEFVTPVTPPSSCGSLAYQSQLVPASILLVMDRSLTMACNPPPLTATADCEATPGTADPAQPTKWGILGGALSSALDTLQAVPNTSLGLTLFSNDDECGVQSAPNVGLQPLTQPQMDALKSSIGQVKPGGATPMVGATVLAYKYLHEIARATGNRFVVLVTDGVDNCQPFYEKEGVTGDPFQLLEMEIGKALSVNIRTFVIGTPGSAGARGTLSRMALLGGTARDPGCDASADPPAGTECHFDMTRTTDFAADLGAALGRIAGTTALSCEFDVPTPPDGKAIDPDKVNVDYYRGGDTSDPASKVELYRDDTAPCDTGANGWQYFEGGTKIHLCGPACEEARGDASARVVVSVDCKEQRTIR